MQICFFFNWLVSSTFSIWLYRNELLKTLPGVRFLKAVHMAGAQNKSLISNTDYTVDSVLSRLCLVSSKVNKRNRNPNL